jgi:hypothetical protein
MGIKKTIEVLNAIQADGVIGRYAIAGAVAAYNYIEPAITHDLDILHAFEDTSASALEIFCARMSIADPCDLTRTQ